MTDYSADGASRTVRSSAELADTGRAAAASRADITRMKCEAAMRKIEAAVDKNNGLYPGNHGRVSFQEVMRVAGLSKAALEKSHHAATKQAVQTWLEGVQYRVARGAPEIRRTITKRVDAATEQRQDILQAWHEAELEYHENRIKLAKFIEENARLKAELGRLRVELAGDNVVAIPAKTGKR